MLSKFVIILASSLVQLATAVEADALIIEPCVRSIGALIGIVTLVLGVWHVDRTWDELGSAAYERAKGSTLGNDLEVAISRAGGHGQKVVISEAELDKAFPFPWAFLLGWLILAVSFLFSTEGSQLQISFPNILGMVFSLALGVIASVPMGDAVRNRKAQKKRMLGMMFVLSWLCLSVFTSLDEDFKLRNNGLSLILCLLGAVSIIASMKILWKNRKMGDTWEQMAEPNAHPVVYNMGGPLFVFGWFLFWAGMAAKNTIDGRMLWTVDCTAGASCGLPIFFNARTLLAFFSGCGMVPVVMMLDYAHDEGGEYVGFGTDGKYFGRFFETPIPFLTMWTVYGFSQLLTLDNTFGSATETRSLVVLMNCILQGIVAGILIQTALYEGDMKRKNKWSVVFVLLFLSLGINLGFLPDYSRINAGGLGLFFGIFGSILVIAGQKTVFGDRKRGDYFMQNGKSNPNPIVYSFGEPLFMTGWILLALAMSLSY